MLGNGRTLGMWLLPRVAFMKCRGALLHFATARGPDSDSCRRAIMPDTNHGPVKVETPAEWGDFDFGRADAASMLETSIAMDAVGEENNGSAEAGRPKDLIIYKVTAQAVDRETVDITKDLVEEPFHPLQIKVQPRSR